MLNLMTLRLDNLVNNLVTNSFCYRDTVII